MNIGYTEKNLLDRRFLARDLMRDISVLNLSIGCSNVNILKL